MDWLRIDSIEAVPALLEKSAAQPVLIFKHSPRCSVSFVALSRWERNWNEEAGKAFLPYMVDVINERPISNKLAELLQVRHESPQILVIRDRKCIYDTSHLDIQVDEAVEAVLKTL